MLRKNLEGIERSKAISHSMISTGRVSASAWDGMRSTILCRDPAFPKDVSMEGYLV